MAAATTSGSRRFLPLPSGAGSFHRTELIMPFSVGLRSAMALTACAVLCSCLQVALCISSYQKRSVKIAMALLLSRAELFRVWLFAVLIAELFDPLLCFPLVIVGEPLKKQKRENVSLVVLDLAPQACVCNSPEQTAKLLFGKWHKSSAREVNYVDFVDARLKLGSRCRASAAARGPELEYSGT